MKKLLLLASALTILVIAMSSVAFASEDDSELARYLYSEFEAITPEQHYAFSQREQISDEALLQILGINQRQARITLDRSTLETLTDQELDILMEPFREIGHALNERYGTSIVMPYLYGLEEWQAPDSLREGFIRILSNEITFDVWFSSIRENIEMSMAHIQHNAHAAMVIDGRLSVEEFVEMYSVETEYDLHLESYIDIMPLSSRTSTRTNMLFSGVHGNNVYEFVASLTATVFTDRVGIISFAYPSNRWSMFFQRPTVTPFRWTWHPNVWFSGGVTLSTSMQTKTITWGGGSFLRDNQTFVNVLTNPSTTFAAWNF